MTERMQFDMSIEAKRFQNMVSEGVDRDVLQAYADQQIKTDVGERLDLAESHYVYEIKNGKFYGEGIDEPFEEVIERGIIQNWDGSREKAELGTYRFVQDYMANPDTPDDAIVFNPSLPDGQNYNKNYLDVYKKVGNEVHTVRYFSDLSGEEYREKILEINPAYAQAIPERPTDVDFFLSPVIVPNHLNLNPDQLAQFILGDKKGMNEAEFQRIWNDPNLVSLRLSIINTLVDNPWAILNLQESQKALYAGARKVKDKEFMPIFNGFQMKIQYLAGQRETLGGGGCGSGACSTNSSFEIQSSMKDKFGPTKFSCPDCGETNTRPMDQLISNCQNCGSDKVLPPSVKIS